MIASLTFALASAPRPFIASTINVCVYYSSFENHSPRFFSVPLILIWRFLINLRQVNLPNVTITTIDHQNTILHFRIPTVHDVIGNMGESLVFGDDLDVNDFEETDHH